MLKHKLLVGLASAAVVLSGAAFANGGSMDSSYAAPMAGSDDNGAGVYVGAQAGYGLTHWKNLQASGPENDISIRNSNGFAGRLFAGYSFNKNLGIEAGWTYLPTVKFTPEGAAQDKIKNWAADISGVLSVPVQDAFGVFGKVGLGYLRSNKAPSMSNDTLTYKNLGAWNVTFGAGAYYNITDQVKATLSWQQFQGHTKLDNKYQPNPDIFLVGLQYRFKTDFFGGNA